MNHHNQSEKSERSAVNWLLALAALVLMPLVASATVVGDWDVTVLIRTDVTPIRVAPGFIPEHSVDSFNDTYSFTNSGFRTSGINNAPWVQSKGKYTVSLDFYNVQDLEQQFRDSIHELNSNIEIRQLKLVSRKLTGYELDNGLWGSERYEYRIDSCLDYCEVVKVVQTLQIVGLEPKANAAAKVAGFSAQNAETKSTRSGAVDAAVDAVLKHMRRQGAAAQ